MSELPWLRQVCMKIELFHRVTQDVLQDWEEKKSSGSYRTLNRRLLKENTCFWFSQIFSF